jgi:hypothetical protein
MYYEADYSVESVTESRDGRTFEATKHGRRTNRGRNNMDGLAVPESVDVEPGDVVRIKVENHSDESGCSSQSWALERFIGFPYEKERGWEPLDGLDE